MEVKIGIDTKLTKMQVNIKNAEEIWKKALKMLNGKCPKKGCDEEECGCWVGSLRTDKLKI